MSKLARAAVWSLAAGGIALLNTTNATGAELTMLELTPGSEGSDPGWYVAYDNAVYFDANNRIWRYDGVTATQLTAASGTYNAATSYPTVHANKLYFSSNDGGGDYSLWQHSAGTSVATKVLDHDTSIYYLASNDTHLYYGVGNRLRRFDGTTESANLVSGNVNSLHRFGSRIYFQGSGGSSSQLRSIGGTETNYTSHPFGITPFTAVQQLATVGDEMYFSAIASGHGRQYWKMTAAGVITRQSNTSGENLLYEATAWNGAVYFIERAADRWKLWKTGDTAPLMDLGPITADIEDRAGLVALSDGIYFAANFDDTVAEDVGRELWKYDGQTVSLVADLNAGPGSSMPNELFGFNDHTLFFSANDGINGNEIRILQLPEPSLSLLLLAAPALLMRRRRIGHNC